MAKYLEKWSVLCQFDMVTWSHPTQMPWHILSNSVVLLHDITTAILLAKLKYCCKSSDTKSGTPPPPPQSHTKNFYDLAFSVYFLFCILKETPIWNKVIFKRWYENSCREMVRWARTWFLSSRLNKFVRCPNKCLNRFSDWVKKWLQICILIQFDILGLLLIKINILPLYLCNFLFKHIFFFLHFLIVNNFQKFFWVFFIAY